MSKGFRSLQSRSNGENTDQQKSNPQRITLPVILTLLFLALKLMGYITWSWWWVLSPMLFSAGLIFVLFMTIIVWNHFTKNPWSH